MIQIQPIWLLLCISAYCVLADKYTDENRPYEFGFTIEGEQHRHEKKDENGIIMGEFGFITADGVYHVTVYATDENGNFKILSMKNIRVKPYPTGPTQNTRQGHSLELSSSPQPKTNVQINSSTQNIKQELNSGPAKACSHCIVPTTTTQSPKLSNDRSLNSYYQQQEKQYNTNIQSNRNTFSQNSFNQDYNTQEKMHQNKQKLSSNDQTVTGQVYSGNFPNESPSREINTPLISSYPQSSDIGQSISQQGQVSLANYPQTTGQVYSENLPNEPPSREINTPLISNYPQSYDLGQGVSQQGQVSLANYPQTYENSPQIPYAVPQYTQRSPSLNSNSGELNPQTLGQTEIAESGKIPESNVFNSEKFNSKSYGKDQNLSNINKANYVPNTVVPQNSANINRQPKSFDDILESVNPEVEYNSAVQSQGSLQRNANSLPKKPVLVAAQMEIVDKNTDIYHKNPGEKDGLPEGLTGADIKQLLYTFNYTLGFHGHHEKGYRNGAKYGYYFVTGRNGVRTRVDYIADETGFHPKISQEVLDILSEDVPKPETEKDEKYGLRGYEFKWLYYPVDSP